MSSATTNSSSSKLDDKLQPKEKFSVMHLLPCDIDYNGTAPVNSFFQVKREEVRGQKIMKSHFRGRELIGEWIVRCLFAISCVI